MALKYKITSHYVQDIRMFKKLIKALDGVGRKLFKKIVGKVEMAPE